MIVKRKTNSDYGEVLKHISKNISLKISHKAFLKSTFELVTQAMSLSGLYLITCENQHSKFEYVQWHQGELLFSSRENNVLFCRISQWYEKKSQDGGVVTCTSIADDYVLQEIEALKRNQIASFIMAPIYQNQKRIGLMCFTRKSAHQWRIDEINMLHAICLLMNLEVCNESVNKQLVYETQKLEHLSKFDEMTGLYNRSYFESSFDRIDHMDSYPMAVIMGDLNGLKLINDAYGHATGDCMLRHTGILISRVVGELGIAGRWGGDEFLIVLPKCNEQDASRICCEIKTAFKISESMLSYNSISLGYAIKNNADISKDKIIKEAEDYMYKKKLHESRSQRSFIIHSMQKNLREKSYETEVHAVCIFALCKAIGRELGLTNKEMGDLELFAVLHDIGKITLRDDILEKYDRLSPEEWEMMKEHPESGYRILKAVPELAHIAELVLYHHERWDGSGYPQGIAGEQIPLLSRILSVADVYDTILNDRGYKKVRSKEEAIQEIVLNAGRQFDPQVVAAFVTVMDK